MKPHRRWLAALAALASGASHALPLEGDFANHSAATFLILGVAAILIGVRSLRTCMRTHRAPIRRVVESQKQRNQQYESQLPY